MTRSAWQVPISGRVAHFMPLPGKRDAPNRIERAACRKLVNPWFATRADDKTPRCAMCRKVVNG